MSIFLNNIASGNFLENGRNAIIQLTRQVSDPSCHFSQSGQHEGRKCTRWYTLY